MKKILCALLVGFSVSRSIGQEECVLDRFYAGISGAMMLPEGGADARRLAGSELRFGWYPVEFWALEGSFSVLEDSLGAGVQVLRHWWGYERFDPFFTFGARGWFGEGASDLGPKAGIGAFYHINDEFSLRFDADATLALDGAEDVFYTLAVGLQWSF